MLYSFMPHGPGPISYFVQAPNKQLAIRSVINWAKENQGKSYRDQSRYDLGFPNRSTGSMLRDLMKNYTVTEAAAMQVVTRPNN